MSKSKSSRIKNKTRYMKCEYDRTVINRYKWKDTHDQLIRLDYMYQRYLRINDYDAFICVLTQYNKELFSKLKSHKDYTNVKKNKAFKIWIFVYSNLISQRTFNSVAYSTIKQSIRCTTNKLINLDKLVWK